MAEWEQLKRVTANPIAVRGSAGLAEMPSTRVETFSTDVSGEPGVGVRAA